MKYFLLFVALLSVNSYSEKVDCSLLIGDWTIDVYDKTTDSDRAAVISYLRDGRFRISDIRQNLEVGTIEQNEEGQWSCDGEILFVRTTSVDGYKVDYTDLYKILELTKDYRKIEALDIGCSEVITDCPATFEAFRSK